jgi:hypothetical protein
MYFHSSHNTHTHTQANRQQVLKWLGQNTIDPNDPRNAPLMELMKAQEATSGGTVCVWVCANLRVCLSCVSVCLTLLELMKAQEATSGGTMCVCVYANVCMCLSCVIVCLTPMELVKAQEATSGGTICVCACMNVCLCVRF